MNVINTKQPGDCGYIGMFNGKQIEFYAPSLYKAKEKAVTYFRPARSKEHMVHVYLVERADGSTVDQTL
jgi:hypothetical protein